MGASTGWEFESIPIDFEVFKALTALLNSPADSYNDVLRRLLTLRSKFDASALSVGRPWTLDGVTLPHGTELRMRYNRQFHTGRVDDGMLVVNGARYGTPSAAAMSITKYNVNGWQYWQCRHPRSSGWTSIDTRNPK